MFGEAAVKLLRYYGIASGISVVLEVVNSIPVSSFFFIGQQASMLMLPFFCLIRKCAVTRASYQHAIGGHRLVDCVYDNTEADRKWHPEL